MEQATSQSTYILLLYFVEYILCFHLKYIFHDSLICICRLLLVIIICFYTHMISCVFINHKIL